jgi:hypothetical protein
MLLYTPDLNLPMRAVIRVKPLSNLLTFPALLCANTSN